MKEKNIYTHGVKEFLTLWVSRSNGYGIGLQRQAWGVQVPPADSFSWQIFETEEEEAEKRNALANFTTGGKREQR